MALLLFSLAFLGVFVATQSFALALVAAVVVFIGWLVLAFVAKVALNLRGRR